MASANIFEYWRDPCKTTVMNRKKVDYVEPLLKLIFNIKDLTWFRTPNAAAKRKCTFSPFYSKLNVATYRGILFYIDNVSASWVRR